MTAWNRERWRRLYLHEPLEQEAWPWQTRGLRNLLIQRAEDSGFVARTREALARALRGDEDDGFEEALGTLLEDGFLVELDVGLYVRNLPLAQGDGGADDGPPDTSDTDPSPPPSDPPDEPPPAGGETVAQRRKRLARVRAKRYRASRSSVTDSVTASVTQRDASRVTSVTPSVTERDASLPPSHSPSPIRISGSERTLERTNGSESGSGSGPRVTDSVTASRVTSVTGNASRVTSVTERDAEGPCPTDLADRCRKVGLVASLAKRFGATEPDVVAVIDEFVEFWVVTRGGQAQRNWIGKVRARVEAKHRTGELVGAGGPPAGGLSAEAAARRDARLAREQAASEEHQRKLIAEHGTAPPGVRDVRSLIPAIGGGGNG